MGEKKIKAAFIKESPIDPDAKKPKKDEVVIPEVETINGVVQRRPKEDHQAYMNRVGEHVDAMIEAEKTDNSDLDIA